MATSPYISQQVKSEQNLYEDLVIEALKFYGQDVYYIPREIVNKDKIFIDDVPSRFSDSYKIEMYIENTEGYGGEGDLFTKFGIELRDQITFVVARRRWKSLIGSYLDENNFRPREGDVIYLPMTQAIFQILKVETETPFYQLSQLPTFRLTCELFEYSDEDFDTGIDNLDIVEIEGAYQQEIQMFSTDSAVATATTTINPETGGITGLTLTSGGRGYASAPTVSISDFTTDSIVKFGKKSLNTSLGRGVEQPFLSTNDNGVVEMFMRVTTPVSGYGAFLLFGGDQDDETQTYLWSVDNGGGLYYHKGNNDSDTSPIAITGVTITEDVWHHLAIAQDSSQMCVYLNGTKVLDSDFGTNFKFAGDNGFSVGTTAVRTWSGQDYNVPNILIDDLHFQKGTRYDLLYDRYGDSSSVLNVPTAAADSGANTLYYNSFDGDSASVTATIDTAFGTVSSFSIVDSGFNYTTAPTATIGAPSSDSGDFAIGEIVRQVNTNYTITGEVTRWSDSDEILKLAHIGSTDGKYHPFTTYRPITGDTSGASWIPKSIKEIIDSQSEIQNKTFDDFEGDFLDFSESNPFGDLR